MDDRPDEGSRIGALYRVDPSGKVERKVEGVQISNGLAWTADGDFMFYADTRGPWIDRWSFDRKTGAMSERTPLRRARRARAGRTAAAATRRALLERRRLGGQLNRFAPDGGWSTHIRCRSSRRPCRASAARIFARST